MAPSGAVFILRTLFASNCPTTGLVVYRTAGSVRELFRAGFAGRRFAHATRAVVCMVGLCPSLTLVVAQSVADSGL